MVECEEHKTNGVKPMRGLAHKSRGTEDERHSWTCDFKTFGGSLLWVKPIKIGSSCEEILCPTPPPKMEAEAS